MAPLLPAAATVVEAFGDTVPAPLFPEEEQLVARAVDKRRAEFATARRCAREALAQHGFAPAPLLTGERGQPLWPAGTVGSITHCAGYRAAVVARAADLGSVGVDAEPHHPLPDGVLDTIALPAELARLRTLAAAHPGVCWDRVLFSAKESVYKAWFPLALRWLDFTEADLAFDPDTGTFSATVLVDAPRYGDGPLSRFDGRFAASAGLVVTAVTVPARP
ncbi:4'-phosphopantetheinyl transferase superfamily protein [Catellatospora coxensis]|uniref:4'-phosphopantetheinyl transferase n=2 Tax=Catellatospora coxensis TaxID=310354 RepID=A0A8J3KLN0_9ACTN|nr:4'-phosphopantetheinyl transferase [Catellatospora coxensis]